MLPAIKPDVALLHAPMADRFGNVWIGRQRELATMAHAAAKTIVTVEKIHDGNLLDDPVLAAGTLPGFYVESIAVAEHGAWPLGLPDHYSADADHLAEYARMAATHGRFHGLLREVCPCQTRRVSSALSPVMPGFMPGIHAFLALPRRRGWPGRARP